MIRIAFLLCFLANICFSSNSSDVDNLVIVKNLTNLKFPAVLEAGTVHVLHKLLTSQDALDLMRVGVSIEPKDMVYTGTDPILEVMVANGRDSFTITLPVVYRNNQTVYTYGKMLSPILPSDVLKNRRKAPLTQNLVITVQSRLRENISYALHLTHLDRSQYEIRFKENENTRVINNLSLTFVKPTGFYVDPKKQNISALRLSVSSYDDMCATLVVSPNNVSLYDTKYDDFYSNELRVLTFSKRADVYFSDQEVLAYQSFRIFVFIDADDFACNPKAEKRKYLLKTKKMSFEFARVQTNSYLYPIAIMIIVFSIPIILFGGSTSYQGFKSVSSMISSTSQQPLEHSPDSSDDHRDSPENLIHFESNETPSVQGNLVSVTLNTDETDEILDEEITPQNVNVNVNVSQPVQDSLSMHSEMLKYPLAIILPVFMHTGLEYHKWSTSSTANRDEMCFHNHACAHPYGEFRALNNLISNLGYFIYGILFVGITLQRRSMRHRLHENYNKFGVNECVLLDVTIGVFLMMQAIASATYHLCPSDVAFQFDTPFIQVICGLLVIRQWFIRQESPSAAYANSILVAVVFANFLISAFSHYNNFRYYIAAVHLLTVFTLCAKKRNILNRLSVSQSKYSLYFTVVFLVINVLIAIMYIFSETIFHLNQITTCCFIVNCAAYLVYYTVMKIVFGEKIPNTAKLTGLLSVLFWIAALYFFLQEDTDWTKTAAQSRALNKPCVWMGFFGYHDMWHIFGAFASLSTFVYVQYTDDALWNIPRRAVNIF